MHKLAILSLLISISIGMLACDLLTVDENIAEYPTTYNAIDFTELEQMNEEYQQANGGHICSTLNKYGFTGYSELFFVDDKSPCQDRNVVRIEMDNTDTLESAAKKSLIKNNKYTGVEDTASLRLLRMEPLAGCIICEGPDENRVNIEWKLTFDNQRIDTVEVRDTEITVFIDAKGVNRIWGNWYSEFKIPDFVNFGYIDAQQSLADKLKIDMRPYTGEEEIYTVRSEDLTEKPKKTYIPVENADKGTLELRSCWEVPVSYSMDENFEGWLAYIDIEEGFLVEISAK